MCCPDVTAVTVLVHGRFICINIITYSELFFSFILDEREVGGWGAGNDYMTMCAYSYHSIIIIIMILYTYINICNIDMCMCGLYCDMISSWGCYHFLRNSNNNNSDGSNNNIILSILICRLLLNLIIPDIDILTYIPTYAMIK